jgi:alkylhydroperoxidase family enzyme
MARISGVEAVDQDELNAVEARVRLERQTSAIYGHRPQSTKAFFELLESFGADADGTLSPRLLELVRLRIAFWNQCRSCMSLRYQPGLVDEEAVCSLEKPDDAADLDDAEKAALRFADLFATNHLAIDDDVYDDLRRHFSEGELVELGMYCATLTGFGRLAATWRLTDHLDDRFQGDKEEPFVPWAGGALI